MSPIEDPNRAVRMLAPPRFARRVDVPARLVASKLAQGYRIDPEPDARPVLAAEFPGRHRGRPALVVASGPSAGLADRATLLRWAGRTDAVVWGVNNVFSVLGGLPLPADYAVVLDRHYFEGKLDRLAAWARAFPRAEFALAFDPPGSVPFAARYHRLHIPMADRPDRDPPYAPGRYFNGGSGGIAAVSMALHAGCAPVYLLGHDCATAAGMTHGDGVRSRGELKGGYPQGLTMLPGYAILAKHAAGLGVPVYNLSPVSAIGCFPRARLVQRTRRPRQENHA